MTLGRPILSSREATIPLPSAVDDVYLEDEQGAHTQPKGSYSKNTFLVETIRLYAMCGEVLTQIYKPWQDEMADGLERDYSLPDSVLNIVVGVERQLSTFKENLPVPLNWDCVEQHRGESWISERQRNILYTR